MIYAAKAYVASEPLLSEVYSWFTAGFDTKDWH
jgi:hypothetical protein